MARKHLAQRDGVPLYAVCSNEQLAALVTHRISSLGEMAAIEGMGAARGCALRRRVAGRCWRAVTGLWLPQPHHPAIQPGLSVKRLRITLADLADRHNLALACWKAARGKRQRRRWRGIWPHWTSDCTTWPRPS